MPEAKKDAKKDAKKIVKPAVKKPVAKKAAAPATKTVVEKTKKGKAPTKATVTAKKTATTKTVSTKPAATKTTAAKTATTKTTGKTPVIKEKLAGKKKEQINVRPSGKAQAAEMMNGLYKRYPDADCELDHKNAYELLIAVIMSAQSTDVTINKITPKLFRIFPTPKDLAEGDIERIKQIILPSGFYNAKAKNIQECARALVTKYGGEVPMNREELVQLPGVGRKTANVVLGVVGKIPGWTVDTHVQRLSKRLGFTRNEDPYKIELDLDELLPPDKFDASQASITLIWHGRRCCFARKPDCPGCPINQLCPSSEVP